MKRNKLYSLLTAILLVCTLFLSVSLTACKPKNPNPDSGSTSVKATVTGITLDTASVKKSFEYAEAFTYEGLKVTAQMSDKTTKNVDLKDCKISEPDTSRAGKRNVTVSYEGKTAFYRITVAKRVYPDITKEALLAITGENDSVAYRVEAENIDMAVSSVKKQNSATNFVAQAPLDAEITSGNAYLSNYGVKYNYFGYKFTSDKAYEGVTIVLRLAYSGNGALSLNNNFALYLNRAETDEGVVGEISMEGYTVSGGTCVWSDLVLRNQTIKEGENTMTFEALSENVPDIDYIDFYVGKRYISSIVEMTEQTEYVKEIEDFDTEKAKTREDVAKAHNLKDGQLFVETVAKESEGKTTSGGKSVGAIAKGSQLSTTLRLAQKATVKITFIAACVGKGAYKVRDNWAFGIDGTTLENVQDVDISGGDASNGEWWDWNPTTLGVYNLPAGDHLFLIEVTGGDCNVDCMKFEVISLGKYDESGIAVGEHVCTSKCETCGKCKNADCTKDACKEKCECKPETFDAVINGTGTVKAEAENLDTTRWVHQAGVPTFTEEWNNDMGSGVCAKGLGAGTVITVNVKVEKKCTLALGVVMSHYDSETYDFSNKELKFGDTVLTAVPSGKFGHREASDYWKWVDVSLGKVEVEAGEYVLSANLYAVNIDYFYFTAIDATVASSGVTTIEMENLTDMDVKTRPDFVNAGRAEDGKFALDVTDTASNGKAISGFQDGTVFNVNFLVTEAGTYKISLVGANDTDYPVSNMSFMLDGKEITVSSGNLVGTTHDGIPSYWDWQTIELSSSALTTGAHTLTIKIISGHPNLDCVKIEAVAAPTAE